MNPFEEIKNMLPQRLKAALFETYPAADRLEYDRLQEIRLRAEKPLIILYDGRERVFESLIVSVFEVRQCLQYISEYSLYAHQEDIRQGFITVAGGHRVGLAGQVLLDHQTVTGQKYIASINIRVAHQLTGCADSVMPFVWKEGRLAHTLIISPPACGKTTLLRDIIRQLSYGLAGPPQKVGVVDERSELAACHEGIPQNDVGPRTDVLDCATKADGMMMLIRSMSPEVIAVDEIGSQADAEAVEYLMNCGCTVFATAHGISLNQVLKRPFIGRLFGEYGFERAILLSNKSGTGTVDAMIELSSVE